MNLTSLSLRADVIVQGKVIDTRSEWNTEHTKIWTFVTLEVTEVYAGDAKPGKMEIRTLGGRADDMVLHVPGAPQFNVDEELVLFLHVDPTLLIPVVGLEQGKLYVTVDSGTQVETIGNTHVGFFEKKNLKSTIQNARSGR